MPTVFDPQVGPAIAARIGRLRPDSPRLWGKMDAPQMVCHLADACKVALGDTPTTLRPGFLSTRLARWLIISVLPIPRGKARTTREFRLTAPGAWEADIANLKQLFDRVLARGSDPQAGWNTHPAFGELDTAEYGKLIYKHMDHHLRQFGV